MTNEPSSRRAGILDTARAALAPPTPIARGLAHVAFAVAFALFAWAVGRETGSIWSALAVVPLAAVTVIVLLPGESG